MGAWLPLIRQRSGAPIVWSTQNVDSDLWLRAAEHQSKKGQRWAMRWQARAIRRMEERIAAQVEGITAASERDAALYRAMAPHTPIEVIDNGVDVESYRPEPEAEEPATLVYTASYDWLPNADAVEYFCTEIWPKVRAAVPQARFFAVGKAPPPPMRRWNGQDGITVTGMVPDVRPYIARATAYVVPPSDRWGNPIEDSRSDGRGKGDR
ncbi:MAG: hypothetical protein KatS3mg115_2627 [Candidatus Poribacteria bacterium]|nr:MAG: hypothetical protein KatS3mg115_2627 [Candidatus Poribacteria bacterium]